MAATETYIGKPVARKEDAKLLTGQSQYIDDLTLTGMTWAVLVRSPYAHARILSVDVSAARAAEGVVAAFSGADLAEDWAATLPCVWLVTEDTKQPTHLPLATRVAGLRPTAVNRVLAEARQLQLEGRPLVSLMRGQPDTPTPPHVVEAAERALRAGRTGYPDNQGEPGLREAVAEKLARDNRLPYDPGREILRCLLARREVLCRRDAGQQQSCEPEKNPPRPKRGGNGSPTPHQPTSTATRCMALPP